MRTRDSKLLKRVLLLGLAVATFFSPIVLARPPLEDAPHQEWALPESPEARLELWTNTFQRFLDGHPNLSAQQRQALESAIDNVNLDLFADNPGIQQKTRVATLLSKVKQALYCTKYAELFTGLEGLGTWLRINKVVAKQEGTPCNCGAGGCNEGWSCISSGCYAEPGTTNYGRCQQNPPGGDEEILLD